MVQATESLVGRRVRIISHGEDTREELTEVAGSLAAIVDTLDHVLLVTIIDEEEAFMVRREEVLIERSPESWNIGEQIAFEYNGRELRGKIYTPMMVRAGGIWYGIEYAEGYGEGHEVIPADSFLF